MCGYCSCRIDESIPQPEGASPSELFDAGNKDLDDRRGKTRSRPRTLINQADPDVVEEWKWSGVPVRYHDGMVCTGETYKSVVKTTLAERAGLKDPSGLFNSSLERKVRRAIDIHEGERVDEEALMALVRSAVVLNESSARR